MQNAPLTPWNFSNNGSCFYSPDALQRLDYEDLREMNQGGPLHGSCFWVTADNQRCQLPGTYGGPPIWNTTGNRVALPLWSQALLWGADQHLATLDTHLSKLVIFKQRFHVLHLQAFEDLFITGIDSPAYNPSSLLFNLETAAIKHVFEL